MRIPIYGDLLTEETSSHLKEQVESDVGRELTWDETLSELYKDGLPYIVVLSDEDLNIGRKIQIKANEEYFIAYNIMGHQVLSYELVPDKDNVILTRKWRNFMSGQDDWRTLLEDIIDDLIESGNGFDDLGSTTEKVFRLRRLLEIEFKNKNGGMKND